nr:transposase [uncultured Paludibaculum sp.]
MAAGTGATVPQAHKDQKCLGFVAQHPDRLWVELLPACAPELNPVEYIWAYWKQRTLPKINPKDNRSWDAAARKARKRMRRPPRRITALRQQDERSF